MSLENGCEWMHSFGLSPFTQACEEKIVCLSFNCCQPFSLFVMHEFIYLLVFVSKRVETALRDKANLTEGDMVLSKEKRFRNNFG